jgi:hypothetical protein
LADFTNFIPAGPQERNKQIQYYEQDGFRDYGPADPTFTTVGVVSSVTPTLNIARKVTRIVGSRYKYSERKLMQEGTVQMGYELLDTIMPRYGILDPAGSGTTGAALSFLESALINGTQAYRFYRDCVTETISFALERDFMITQNFYTSDITDWMSAAELNTALGISATSVPEFAANITGEPWNHLDHEVDPPNTGSPLTVSGDTFLYNSLNIEVNNNLRKLNPGGYDQTKFISPGNLVITGTFNTWLAEGQTMESHTRDFTDNTIVLKIKENTSSDVILTLGGVKFNSFSDTIDAGANEYSLIDYPFEASTISLTAYP